MVAVLALWTVQLLVASALLAKVLTAVEKRNEPDFPSHDRRTTCEVWDDKDTKFKCTDFKRVCRFFDTLCIQQLKNIYRTSCHKLIFIVHTWKLFEFRYLFLFLLNLSAIMPCFRHWFSLMKSSNHARGLESNTHSGVVRIRNTMPRAKKLGVNEYIYIVD